MKNKTKKRIHILAVTIICGIVIIGFIASVPNWSKKSFRAIVQEIVIRPDGEIRMIVERTTEIYGEPLNSLSIGENTVLIDEEENVLSIDDFQPGDSVVVCLKDAFTEETPFYYPIVYEISLSG